MSDYSNDQASPMAEALKIFKGKVDPGKAARKSRQKKLIEADDGRSLRSTGRTEQMNIRVKPEIKAALKEHADSRGEPRTLWLERAIIALLEAEGYEIDG